MHARDVDTTRNQLQERLRALRLRLEEIEGTLCEPDDEDLEEQAADLDDDMVLERLAGAGRDEIRQIRIALERIDKGNYGKCETCGKPIAPERLRALPETSICRRCAEKAT